MCFALSVLFDLAHVIAELVERVESCGERVERRRDFTRHGLVRAMCGQAAAVPVCLGQLATQPVETDPLGVGATQVVDGLTQRVAAFSAPASSPGNRAGARHARVLTGGREISLSAAGEGPPRQSLIRFGRATTLDTLAMTKGDAGV